MANHIHEIQVAHAIRTHLEAVLYGGEELADRYDGRVLELLGDPDIESTVEKIIVGIVESLAVEFANDNPGFDVMAFYENAGVRLMDEQSVREASE